MIKTVTIFDLETTGIKPEESEVVEFGAILYSVEHATILSQTSAFLPVTKNGAQHINSIDPIWTTAIDSQIISSAYELLENFVYTSDYVVAHNKEFDMGWNFANTLSKPWLCTYADFLWEKNHKQASLIQTALNHGVAVTSAHRALTDCGLIASLFTKVYEEKGSLQEFFSKAIERAKDEIIEVVALVSYGEKNKAKSCGFIWDSNSEKSRWIKKIKQSELLEESKSWDFDWFEKLT